MADTVTDRDKLNFFSTGNLSNCMTRISGRPVQLQLEQELHLGGVVDNRVIVAVAVATRVDAILTAKPIKQPGLVQLWYQPTEARGKYFGFCDPRSDLALRPTAAAVSLLALSQPQSISH